jgi:hypothetical protein
MASFVLYFQTAVDVNLQYRPASGSTELGPAILNATVVYPEHAGKRRCLLLRTCYDIQYTTFLDFFRCSRQLPEPGEKDAGGFTLPGQKRAGVNLDLCSAGRMNISSGGASRHRSFGTDVIIVRRRHEIGLAFFSGPTYTESKADL